jgi:hypothetical protein
LINIGFELLYKASHYSQETILSRNAQRHRSVVFGLVYVRTQLLYQASHHTQVTILGRREWGTYHYGVPF